MLSSSARLKTQRGLLMLQLLGVSQPLASIEAAVALGGSEPVQDPSAAGLSDRDVLVQRG